MKTKEVIDALYIRKFNLQASLKDNIQTTYQKDDNQTPAIDRAITIRNTNEICFIENIITLILEDK